MGLSGPFARAVLYKLVSLPVLRRLSPRRSEVERRGVRVLSWAVAQKVITHILQGRPFPNCNDEGYGLLHESLPEKYVVTAGWEGGRVIGADRKKAS